MPRELVTDAQCQVLIRIVIERGLIVMINVSVVIESDGGMTPGVAPADSTRDLDSGGRSRAGFPLRVDSDACEAGIVYGGDFEIRTEVHLGASQGRGRVAAAEDRRPGI